MTRYCIAKDYISNNGRQVWGVYDDVEKKFVESGFFQKAAARESASTWNAEFEATSVKAPVIR